MSEPQTIPVKSRPRRPCDACRKRKSRCEFAEAELACVLCRFHRQECTFLENPAPRKKRRRSQSPEESESTPLQPAGESRGSKEPPWDQSSVSSTAGVSHRPRGSLSGIRQHVPIDDYAKLKGPSLLKRTLGLQTHRHSRLVGPTSILEQGLLPTLDNFRGDIPLGTASIRRVCADTAFILLSDEGTQNREDEIHDLDLIESIVAPHGAELLRLYFRIVHPSFPILHKKVFLEKYERTHREFSPPLLAAVYILALNWWSYSSELAMLPRPDLPKLEKLALKSMSDIIHRPKLSTIQAGLLLLQRPEGDSWALTAQLVSLGQDLGLHLDCTTWKIPGWERGLRKRLAWALYMQDKWGALVHGRPCHIANCNWRVKPVSNEDFPESAADEDDEEGSTEVEKGRTLFAEMIKLSRILATILSGFYTLESQEEAREQAGPGGPGVRWLLDRAKPIQLQLKEWFSQLPPELRLDNVKLRKLSSTGYLHLAYYACEMTLHRPVLKMINHETDESLLQICVSAAKARVSSTIDFVRSLRAEHLQSFWYSASQYNFALLGTFLCLLDRIPAADKSWCRERSEEYKWILRLSSKSADFLDRAISTLTLSTALMAPNSLRQSNRHGANPPDEDDSDEEEEEVVLASEDVSQFSPTAAADPHLEQSWFDFGSPLARFDLNEAMGTDPNFIYADESGAAMRYTGPGNESQEHR